MLFIKKVYRYSKPLGIGMLFFVVIQLFCFYKGGMVFSPWYNYGMYSERINVKPVYGVFYQRHTSEFMKLLSPQRDDKVNYTISQFNNLRLNDSLYEKEIKRIAHKLHLPVPPKEKYLCSVTSISFREWFHKYQYWYRGESALVFKEVPQYEEVRRAVWNGNELFMPRGYFSDSNDNPILFK